MLFKGRLRLPNDPGEGIPIDLEIEDVFLSLESGGEDFGEWRLDAVEIKRLFSNQFAMDLDGEEMVFIADDALGFAYDGLTAIDDVKSRLSKRRIFKGRKPKKKSIADRSEPELQPEPEAEPAPTPSVPDVPMPEVVPFFPDSSPSFADSVAESAVDEDGIAPVAPKPIEIPDAAPSTTPAQPAAESESVVQPPSEPAPEIEQVASAVEPAEEVEQPAVAAYEPTEVFDDEDDDELVIEDVSPYGYVPVASAPVDQRPVTLEPEASDDEIEIEDAAPPTGALLEEAHPLGESVTAEKVHPLGEPAEPDQLEPVHPKPVAEAAPVVAEPTPSAAEPAAPQGDSSFFSQWSSNGHAQPELESEPEPEPEVHEASSGPQTQKSGRHERTSEKPRSSLFGRKKSREPEAHDHLYESSKTVGGITRSVCSICGHVSFAGEDVYQDW